MTEEVKQKNENEGSIITPRNKQVLVRKVGRRGDLWNHEAVVVAVGADVSQPWLRNEQQVIVGDGVSIDDRLGGDLMLLDEQQILATVKPKCPEALAALIKRMHDANPVSSCTEVTKQQREAAATLAVAEAAHAKAKEAFDESDAESVKALAKAEQALEAAREDARYVDRWTERRQAEINRIVNRNPRWANDADFWADTVQPIVAEVKKEKYPKGMKESELGDWADEIERRVNESLGIAMPESAASRPAEIH